MPTPVTTDPEDIQQADASRACQTPVASDELGKFLVLQRFRGACDDTTAELFFDHGREHQRAARNRQQAAKAICGLCPILAECSLVARTDLTLEGIWGAENQKERRTARRRAHGQAIPAVAPGNPGGRLRVQQAHQHAQRAGVHGAADRLAIPAATLRRLVTLYDLDHQAATAEPALTGVREADRG
jgi:WhiB family transcriptional regulator, redox-sensing transcriptional regulator